MFKLNTEFPLSKVKCPKCGELSVEDNWPPDYEEGVSTFTGDAVLGYKSAEKITGSKKHVCMNCRVAFRYFYEKEYNHSDYSIKTIKDGYSKTVDLVEKDGYLLTPHDVYVQEQVEKNGEYHESYA